MSLLRPEMLENIAISLGIDNLSIDCIDELLPEAEFRLREIIQDALKFRSHSKKFQLETTHINQALKARNIERLYGYNGIGIPQLRQCEEDANLFFLNDEELKIADILQKPLPRIPLEPSLHIHWLAVDGIQPRIPENDVKDEREILNQLKLTEMITSNSDIERKSVVKHVLTDEMQLYYAKVVETIMTTESMENQRTVFTSLSNDPGIHQLLPYFSRFIYDEVKRSHEDLTTLSSLMRMCECLLLNPHLQVELYLHQMLPAILTCVMGRQLCGNPAEDHWALRKFSAQLVAHICHRYGETYKLLQARVLKTYHTVINDESSPFTTQYGVLYGMLYLGPLVLESLLFPSVKTYFARLENALSSSNSNLIERLEAQHCLGILVHASGMYFSMQNSTEKKTSPLQYEVTPVVVLENIVETLYEAFGESLLPYISPSSYTEQLDMCL